MELDPILLFLGMLIMGVLGFTFILVAVVQAYYIVAWILVALLVLFFLRLLAMEVDWKGIFVSEEEGE